MLSRILGFVRDLVLARLFGADALTDAFFVAFKIPNFLRRLFAEGAFATAFVPVLTEYKTQREYRELKHFVDAIAGTLGLVLLDCDRLWRDCGTGGGVLICLWLGDGG